MKKIIIVGISLLCVVSFVLFMAQRCGPEDYLDGTWELVTDYYVPEPPGSYSESVLIIESDSFDQYAYVHHPPNESYPEGEDFFALGMKGTLTIFGSTMTQTITHLTTYDPAYGTPEWFDEDDNPDLWIELIPHVPGGQTTVYIFGMSKDTNHLFLHTDDYMPYNGDALHYERQ